MTGSITFLGTGTSQGVPVISCKCDVCRSSDPRDKRLRTSALIRSGGRSILIDAGPDFRQQMLRCRVDSLDAILLTHQHKDHIAGLDDVRAFNYSEKTGYKECRPFPIYCEERVLEALRREFAYAFAENRYPGVPQFDVHLIDERPFEVDGLRVVPIRAMHYRLPVLGFRFGNLAYITDANYIPDGEFSKLDGVKVLVLNTVRKTPHISHFSLPQAVEVARRVGAERTFLTHLSHQMPSHAALEAELPDGIFPAYDSLEIEF